MKKYIYTLLITFTFPFLAKGQSTDKNYTKATTYQNPYSWSEIQSGIYADDKLEVISYFDGLGRGTQTINERAGADREDLVIPILYDEIGRKPKDYLQLPTAAGGGNFYVPATGTIVEELIAYYKTKFPKDFHQGGGLYPDGWDNPYSNIHYEASPLNRVLEQGAPGMEWRVEEGVDTDHTIKFEYLTNTATDAVIHFNVIFGTDYSDPSLNYNGVYATDELYKNVTKNENWTSADGNDKTTEEYTNKKGQMILKRTFNNGTAHDTYYVFDDDGNLTYVLSPKGSNTILDVNNNIKQDVLEKLCYQYKYDHRARITHKWIPGRTGWEEIVYDVLDRPILTQDPKMAQSNDWMFTKYDVLGRVAYTGILRNYTKAQVQSGMAASGVPLYENQTATTPSTIGGSTVYYSNQAFPNDSNLEVHTISYYDSYVDLGGLSALPAQNAYSVPLTTNTKGLPTVSKVRVLTGLPSSQHWNTTASGYDDKARIIYLDSEIPFLGTTDRLESLLDFTGKPLETLTTHTKDFIPDNTIITHDYFTYDHQGRLLTHEQQVSNESVELIVENRYDGLGQLIRKNVGGETFIDGFTDIEEADVSFDGTISRTTGGFGWTSGVKTKGQIVNDGGVAYTILQEDKFVRVGLQKANALLNGWEDYEFAIYNKNDATISFLVNGVIQTSLETYVTGDSFSVERIGTSIVFKKNNLVFGPTNVTDTSGDALIGKASIYTGYGELEDFGLFGSQIDKILQKVDLTYNVRGWLTDINDVGSTITLGPDIKLFNFRINYKEVEGNSNGTPLYNGNIAQTLWKTDNDDDDVRGYNYTYDNLNRIETATSYQGVNLNTMSLTNTFNVNNISYDLNGNITSLKRFGTDQNNGAYNEWDDLDYFYDNGGNQLTKVTDKSSTSPYHDLGFKDGSNTSDDYSYDANGNMVSDLNKDITQIDYNHLNLPELITVSGTNSGTISYIYDATGTKLAKTVTQNSTSHITEFAGNYMYLDDELQFFYHPEGYVQKVAGTNDSVKESKGGETTQTEFHYVYQYTDHLGNIRLSFSDGDKNGSINPTSEIIEESNYYPFGLKQMGYNNTILGGNSLAQQWKYNGVQFNEDLGIDLYEMDLRSYDPAIARFNGIDPVTHYTQGTSVAFDNNPIYWADPSGADATGQVPLSYQHFMETGDASAVGFGGHQSSGAPLGGGSNPKGENDPPNKYKKWFAAKRKEIANSDYTIGGQYSDVNPATEFVMGTWAGNEITIDGILNLPSNTVNGTINKMDQSLSANAAILSGDIKGGIDQYRQLGGELLGGIFSPVINVKRAVDSALEGNYYSAGANFTMAGNETAISLLGGIAVKNPFGLNSGYGLFGKKGLNFSNYQIQALYANPNAGRGAGTFISIKQGKIGGNVFRLDYGRMHKTNIMSLHYTFRYNVNGRKFGSTKQRSLLKL